MNSEYKSGPSVGQTLVALVATVLIGSVAVVGTVGQAQAVPVKVAVSTLI